MFALQIVLKFGHSYFGDVHDYVDNDLMMMMMTMTMKVEVVMVGRRFSFLIVLLIRWYIVDIHHRNNRRN